jgi:hypothetical protein
MAARARTRLMRLATPSDPTTIDLSFYTLELRLAALVDAARNRGADADQADRVEREMCSLVDMLRLRVAEALAADPPRSAKKARRGQHEAWLKRQLDGLGQGDDA